MPNRSRRLRKKLRVGEFGRTALEGEAETPLHEAAWVGDVEFARALVSTGANVNCIDTAGESPLHGAAACGHVEMVEYLVSAGANVNIQAEATRGFSPLHWAAGWGGLEPTVALVKAGANVHAKDAYGLTPEQIAVEHQRNDVADFLRSVA